MKTVLITGASGGIGQAMAMAFAPAALVRPEGITIQNVEVVSKSYPHFWDDLKAAGFQLIQQS